MLLYKYLKALQRKDQSALRKSIIRYYKRHSLILRQVDACYYQTPDKLKFIWALAFTSKLLFFHLSFPKESRNIHLGTKKNETDSLRKELGMNIPLSKGLYRLYPNINFLFAMLSGKIFLFCKISNRLGRKNDLIVFLRSMDYLVYSYLFRSLKADSLSHSSEGDPLINAVSAIAKKQNGPITFIDHGLLPLPLGNFPFDKIITTNFRNFTLLKFKYPQKSISYNGNRYQLNGIKVNFQNNKIGIIDSLTTDPERLNFLIKKINSEFPGYSIYFRWHPNRLLPLDKNMKIFSGKDIEFDGCLFVLAGNSGHAVKTLAKKIPVLYDSALDASPYDLYFLKRDDMLLEQDLNDPFNIDAIAEFYNSDNWIKNWNSNF